MHLAAPCGVPRQIVIDSATLNVTNLPYQQPFTWSRTRPVNGRNLDTTAMTAGGIPATRELPGAMETVTVDAVLAAVIEALR